MKKKIKKVKEVVVEPYNASIKVLGKVYKSTGNTAKEAIENLKPIGKAAGMSVLTISRGDVKKDKILTSMQTFRLFSLSKLMREIALKNTSLMFNGI